MTWQRIFLVMMILKSILDYTFFYTQTVIFAESDQELQAALNAMFLYCKSLDLEVNPSKNKNHNIF